MKTARVPVTHKLYVLGTAEFRLHTVQVGYTNEFFPAVYKTLAGATRTAAKFGFGVYTLYIQTWSKEFPKANHVAEQVGREAHRLGLKNY